ncbi:pilus assembly protein TadG-related protein [Orrella sp. 11846]|uniref:pilus assembly protein TadG-related protein n=1 Tax=Orrella sp. 11846 TaxID=3409913 RepID=UPI003B5B95A6
MIIVAVLLTALLGFAGLAIDFGNFYLQKARMQSLADASALACAQFDCEENDPRLDAVKSPYDMEGVTVRITQLDVCSEKYPTECAIADVHKQWDTYFIQLFGVPKLSVATTATALAGQAEET